MAETFAVIDFETTGMSPGMGARATEVAAVLVRDGDIVGRYQSLMNSGAWVPPFIEQLTGISNQMLASAPPASTVMRELRDFTQGCALVAHNAAFDSGFWRAELRRAEGAGEADPVFACTLLLSRRLHPEAPNHRLGTLAHWHGLPRGGRAHRALADAEVTAHLLLRLQRTVCERFARDRAPHGLLVALQRVARPKLARCVEAYGAAPA